MTTLTPALFRDRFPEFAGKPDAVIQRWLDEAERNANEAQWDERYDDAVAWQTAHYLAVFASPTIALNAAGASGPVQSETEDRVSKSYAVSDRFSDDDFGSTVYGRRYLTMLKYFVPSRCV